MDSELALLYAALHGATVPPRAGGRPNPFFGRRDDSFRNPRFPIYLVTRLASYDVPSAKTMIDRTLAARNRGKFVIDVSPKSDPAANAWLRNAAVLLPANRVVLDATPSVLYAQHDVIGYASWGSNVGVRGHRQWLRTISRRLRPPRLSTARLFRGTQSSRKLFLSMPLLSWQGILLGDPLTSLGHP